MNTVTLGGLTTGTCILAALGIRWWTHDNHRAGPLAAILVPVAYGIIAIIAGGGILGTLSIAALWGSNSIGDTALIYGVGGTTQDVTRANTHILTSGGYAVVVITTVALICLCCWSKRVPVLRTLLATTAGISFGLVGTIAGAAAVPLASGVNLLGVVFTTVLK